MAIKSYVLKCNYQAPYLRYTGMAHAPQQLKFKQFLKDDIVKGELKHSMNQPIGIIVGGGLFFPTEVIKEVVTKEIKSDMDGNETTIPEKIKQNLTNSDPKVQYIDFAILGTLLGAGSVFAMEKYGIIPVRNKVNYFVGMGIGASLLTYLKWRSVKNKSFKAKD